MYTLFANEKLGMPVENVRLAEIRQAIDSQRLADEVQGRRFGIGTLLEGISSFIAAHKPRFSTDSVETMPVVNTQEI